MRTNLGTLSSPDFLVDRHSAVRAQARQIDWASVGPEFRETPGGTVEVSTNTDADEVALPVVALTFDIPNGTVLQFGADKYITLTSAASVGDESLDIEALTTALVDGDTAVYAGSGKKSIKGGQPMHTDSVSGKMYPRTATAAAMGLLEGPAHEDEDAAPLTGYGLIVGGVVFETFIPNISSTVKTELLAAGSWVFETYADDRAS